MRSYPTPRCEPYLAVWTDPPVCHSAAHTMGEFWLSELYRRSVRSLRGLCEQSGHGLYQLSRKQRGDRCTPGHPHASRA
jgi:hypothetical protein